MPGRKAARYAQSEIHAYYIILSYYVEHAERGALRSLRH